MKSKITKILALVLLCCLTSCSTTVKQQELPIKSVEFQKSSWEEWKLPNGLTILHVEDNELPTVYGTLYIPGGTYWQSSDQLGMLNAMGSQMREGGAGKLSSDQLNKQLDQLAAGISTSINAEVGTFSFSCLEKDVDQVFSLFSDVLLRPKFENSKLNVWKGQYLESISRRIENPSTVSYIAFLQLIYGDSPYGYVTEKKDIEKITRLDLLKMHRKFVVPDGAIFAISGRISRDKVNEIVETNLSKWKGKNELPQLPKVGQVPEPGIYFVNLPITQSSVAIGQLGVERLSYDYMEIGVFNQVFGASGLGLSRLFNRIRTELGLAYSVWGSIDPAVVQGINAITLGTKSESTGVAIRESINVLKEMQRELVEQQEVEQVKRSLENTFVFEFDSPFKVITREASQRLLKYPEDFDQHYLERLNKVTVEDVKKVARQRWDPTKFVIVVAGNDKAYSQLEKEVADSNSPLFGYSLNKVLFDQKLKI